MYDKQFKFNEDGEFRILLFGDPHEKDDFDSKEGKAKRADTLKFHETAFKALKPDLAVYMGDICSILLYTHLRQERKAGIQPLVHGLEQHFL